MVENGRIKEVINIMWGVRFVGNDKSLISFSIISTSWERYKKDNIDL